jgi:hypothetical protein
MTGVKAAATAMKHVSPKRHRIDKEKKRPFDKLRANGVGSE